MGTVIRPAAFARGTMPTGLAPIAPRTRAKRLRRLDFGLLALVLAVMALAWILTLAGAAFTVRALLLVCFATLAGRARRVGTSAPRPVRIRAKR